MIFIFLVILTKCTLIRSEDDQKLIDLLPESEKQAFLDLVVRRLYKEVKTQATENKSREIPEEELEEHGAFVNRILAEESRNLRRNDNGEDKIGVTEIIKADDVHFEEEGTGSHIDLTLRNGKRLKRNSAQKPTRKHNNSGIPVKVIDGKDTTTVKTLRSELSDEIDIQVKGLRRNLNQNNSDLRSHTVINDYEPNDTSENEKDKDDSDSKELPKHGSHSNGITVPILYEQQSSEDESEIEENKTANTPLTTTKATTTTESTTSTKTTKVDVTTTTPKTTTIHINSVTETTNTTLNNTVTLKAKYLRAADSTETLSENITDFSEIQTDGGKMGKFTKLFKNESNNTEVTTVPPLLNINSTDQSFESNEKQNGDNFVEETKSSDEFTSILENVTKLEKETKQEESKSTIFTDGITSTEAPLTINPDVANIASTVYKAFHNVISPNKSKSDNLTTINKEVKVFKNLVKALRSGLKFQFEDSEDSKVNDKSKQLFNDLKPQITKKPYEVYEISANQSPFVKTYQQQSMKKSQRFKAKEKQKHGNEEQPYYVPVYNYAPEQVYFNAHNRLGPNHEWNEEDEEEVNEFTEENVDKIVNSEEELDKILRKFKFNKKPEKTSGLTSRISKPSKFKTPLVIKNPKFAEIYFNPDDYLDMDYYFGRSMRKPKNNNKRPQIGVFPNSGEEEHVRNAMKSGAAPTFKNAVRQILYARHIFGHIPILKTTTESPKSEENLLRSHYVDGSERYQISDRNTAPEEKDEIAVDYYFGFGSNSKKTKDMLLKMARTNNKRKGKGKGSVLPIKGEKEAEAPKGPKRGTIQEILSVYPDDALLHVDELLKYNIPITRTVENDDIEPYFKVLKDLIESDSKALIQYDWLGTTVDIQSALDKLMDLTEILLNGERIHQSDLQLFKYFHYLFETSKSSLDENPLRDQREEDEDRKNALPKNKKRKKEYVKHKGLLHRAWLFKREKLHRQKSLVEVQKFLDDLSYSLYDLHTAIRSIATITTYKKQKWYQHLKDLYLKDLEKKKLLKVLLHTVTTRLFGLLEEAAQDGLEKSYRLYIEEHENMVLRTKKEFVFVLGVLEEIKKLH